MYSSSHSFFKKDDEDDGSLTFDLNTLNFHQTNANAQMLRSPLSTAVHGALPLAQGDKKIEDFNPVAYISTLKKITEFELQLLNPRNSSAQQAYLHTCVRVYNEDLREFAIEKDDVLTPFLQRKFNNKAAGYLSKDCKFLIVKIPEMGEWGSINFPIFTTNILFRHEGNLIFNSGIRESLLQTLDQEFPSRRLG